MGILARSAPQDLHGRAGMPAPQENIPQENIPQKTSWQQPGS
ncbi:hypothetical protein CAL7102_09104 [Dulcicalothrix desertica PCC 7102]|nr:hypothetical protein CAL7102_09104 [Dulcicalothrix desertica PCC 7102]